MSRPDFPAGDVEPSARERTVFVVDDDDAVLNSLRFALEIEGLNVRLFRSSAELLQVLAFPRIGCLVLDYRLPGRDGLQTLALLRRRGVDLPAILTTSHPSGMVRRRAAEAEVEIIEKPHLGNALIEAIRKALDVAGVR